MGGGVGGRGIVCAGALGYEDLFAAHDVDAVRGVGDRLAQEVVVGVVGIILIVNKHFGNVNEIGVWRHEIHFSECVVIGFVLNLFRPAAAARVHNVLKRIAMPALLLLVTIFFFQHKQTIIAEIGSLGLTMTALIIATTGCGALMAWAFRLSTKERRTLVIEIGMQNAAQAITIACSPLIFANEIIAIPAIIYALMMNLILLAYVGLTKLHKS